MRRVTLDVSAVHDGESLHDLFASAFGFPSYYGRNMDAWIDCMEDVVSMEEGRLVLQLDGVEELKKRCPEILQALKESAAFLNDRQREAGGEAIIFLSYPGQ